MPGVSGLELRGALRDRSPPQASTRTAAFDRAAFELLPKPVGATTLEAVVRRACATLPR